MDEQERQRKLQQKRKNSLRSEKKESTFKSIARRTSERRRKRQQQKRDHKQMEHQLGRSPQAAYDLRRQTGRLTPEEQDIESASDEQMDQPEEQEQDQPANEQDNSRQLRKERRTDKQAQAQTGDKPKVDKAAGKPEAAKGGSKNLGASLRKARQAISGQKKTIGAALGPNKQAVIAVGEQIVLEAQRGVWKLAHETIEEAALAYFWVPLMSLIPLGLFTVRFFMGNMLGKMFTISVKGFEVALVPSMTATDFAVRGAKAILFLVLTLIWVIVIFAIVLVIKEFTGTLWGQVLIKLSEIFS